MSLFKTYLLPVFIFTVFIVFSVWCGIGKTHDSRQYEAAAKSFSQSGILLQADGTSFTEWPPLYPVTLSLFSNDISRWGAFVNVICLLISITLWINIAKEYLKESLMIYGLSLGLSTSFLMVGSFLWSESLFLLLLSIYLKLLQLYFKTTKDKWLIISSAMGFLMLLTRNAGIPFIAGTGIAFLISGKLKKLKIVKLLAVHILIVISGLAWWNYKIHKTIELTGLHTNIFTNLNPLVNELTYWFFPELSFLPIKWLFFAGVVFVLILVYRKSESIFIKLLIYQAAIYCSMFTVLLYDFSEMSRLLAVLYPAIMLLVFKALELFIAQYSARKRILIIASVLWLGYPLVRIGHNALNFHSNNCNASTVSLFNF